MSHTPGKTHNPLPARPRRFAKLGTSGVPRGSTRASLPISTSDQTRKLSLAETLRNLYFRRHNISPTPENIKTRQEELYTKLGTDKRGFHAFNNSAAMLAGIPVTVIARLRKVSARYLGVNKGIILYTPKPMTIKNKSCEHGARSGLVDTENLKGDHLEAEVKTTLLHMKVLEKSGEIKNLKFKSITLKSGKILKGYSGENTKDGSVFFWKLPDTTGSIPVGDHSALAKPELKEEAPEWFIDTIPLVVGQPYLERKEIASKKWAEFKQSKPLWVEGNWRPYQEVELFSIQEGQLHREYAAASKIEGKTHFLASDLDLAAIYPPKFSPGNKITNIPQLQKAWAIVKELIKDPVLLADMETIPWAEFCTKAINLPVKTEHPKVKDNQITGINTYFDLFYQLLINNVYQSEERSENRLKARRLSVQEQKMRMHSSVDLTGLPKQESLDVQDELAKAIYFVLHGTDVHNPSPEGSIIEDQMAISPFLDDTGHTKLDLAMLPADTHENQEYYIAAYEWCVENNQLFIVSKSGSFYNDYLKRLPKVDAEPVEKTYLACDGREFLAQEKARASAGAGAPALGESKAPEPTAPRAPFVPEVLEIQDEGRCSSLTQCCTTFWHNLKCWGKSSSVVPAPVADSPAKYEAEETEEAKAPEGP